MKNPHLERLIQRYPILGFCSADIHKAVETLYTSVQGKKKILLCGNGGSASDAKHIGGELMKGFLLPRPLPKAEREQLEKLAGEDIGLHLQGAIPALALTGQLALSTAVSNDNRGDMIFAQQVYGLGNEGDVLLGLSTSGNSRNVLQAFHVARLKGLKTISLCGQSGGRLAGLSNMAIRVPATSVVEIQELHLPVYHAICSELEQLLFGDRE